MVLKQGITIILFFLCPHAYCSLRFKRRPPSEVKSLIYTILSAPQSFALPDDPRATRDMLIDLATYGRALEHDDNFNSRSPSPSNRSTNSSRAPSRASSVRSESRETGRTLHETEDDNNEESLIARIEGLSLGPSGLSKVNEAKLLQTALDIRDEAYGDNRTSIILGKRPEFWNSAPVSFHTSYTLFADLCCIPLVERRE